MQPDIGLMAPIILAPCLLIFMGCRVWSLNPFYISEFWLEKLLWAGSGIAWGYFAEMALSLWLHTNLCLWAQISVVGLLSVVGMVLSWYFAPFVLEWHDYFYGLFFEPPSPPDGFR